MQYQSERFNVFLVLIVPIFYLVLSINLQVAGILRGSSDMLHLCK